MMLNSFAKDAGQVVGFLAKGAEVVVAGSIGLLSYWALKGHEQKKSNIVCEDQIKRLNKGRIANRDARNRKVQEEMRNDAVEAARDQLIVHLIEEGLPVPSEVFDLMQTELKTVAKELKSRDRNELAARLRSVVEDGLGDKISRLADSLVEGSRSKIIVESRGGKTIIDGDVVKILTNDERVGAILARASSNPAGLGKKRETRRCN